MKFLKCKIARTTFVILLFWKDLNKILKSVGLNPLEIMGQKYGIFYQIIANHLHHWTTAATLPSHNYHLTPTKIEIWVRQDNAGLCCAGGAQVKLQCLQGH